MPLDEQSPAEMPGVALWFSLISSTNLCGTHNEPRRDASNLVLRPGMSTPIWIEFCSDSDVPVFVS
jgi:hypothetical protein